MCVCVCVCVGGGGVAFISLWKFPCCTTFATTDSPSRVNRAATECASFEYLHVCARGMAAVCERARARACTLQSFRQGSALRHA